MISYFDKQGILKISNNPEEAGPRGFDPLTCGYLHLHHRLMREGSEDRRDILTTLRAQ